MYGLPSRESLSKRQSRWLRAVDEDVRSNPAQNAFNRETPSNPIRDKPAIISIMTDSDEQIPMSHMEGPGCKPQIMDSGISLSSGQNSSLSGGLHLTSYQNPKSKQINNKTDVKPFNNHLMGIIPEDASDEMSVMQSLYEELRETQKKYTKLEQDCELLKQSLLSYKLSDQSLLTRVQKLETVSEQLSGSASQVSSNESILLNRISKLEQSTQSKFNPDDLLARVKKLETISDISALSARVSLLEKSVSAFSDLSAKAFSPSHLITPVKTILSTINENSSEFSALTVPDLSVPEPVKESKEKELTEVQEVQEFVPYIIKEDYAACDNMTKLKGLHFEMIVEILGFYSETPIIYPFGTETNLPRFAELTLEMSFKDADKAVDGTAYGIFKRRHDGIYTIQLTELYSDGNASGIEKYTLPLTFTCKTDLLLE